MLFQKSHEENSKFQALFLKVLNQRQSSAIGEKGIG